MWEYLIVGLIVIFSTAYVIKLLLPYTIKLFIARHTQGKLPDAVRIWLVSQKACENCK
jgi:hypothetical protein